MEIYAETFGAWQSNACSGARLLAPVFGAADATRPSFTDAARTDATIAGLGQPVAMATATRTHKSITHPGSPPRGRLR